MYVSKNNGAKIVKSSKCHSGVIGGCYQMKTEEKYFSHC